MENIKIYDEKQPCMTQIRALKKGEAIAFPIEMVASLRSNLSTYGIMLRRKFASHVNRETGYIEAPRNK